MENNLTYYDKIIRLGKLMYVYIGLQLVVSFILFLVFNINPLSLNLMSYKIGMASFLACFIPVLFIVRKYEINLISDLKNEFRNFSKQLIWGLLLGLIFVGVVVSLQYFIGVSFKIDFYHNYNLIDLTVWLVLLCLIAFNEEVIFRYLLYKLLGNGWKSMLISSFLFSIMHLGNPNITIIAVTNLFLFGITTWLIYNWYKNLLLLTFLHASWNYTCGFVIGTNISGIKAPTSILTTIIKGKEILTGGNFGIEGSVMTTIVLSSISFIFLCLKQKTELITNDR